MTSESKTAVQIVKEFVSKGKEIHAPEIAPRASFKNGWEHRQATEKAWAAVPGFAAFVTEQAAILSEAIRAYCEAGGMLMGVEAERDVMTEAVVYQPDDKGGFKEVKAFTKTHLPGSYDLRMLTRLIAAEAKGNLE